MKKKRDINFHFLIVRVALVTLLFSAMSAIPGFASVITWERTSSDADWESQNTEVENDIFTLMITGVQKSEDELRVNVSMTNHTEEELNFWLDSSCINGYSCEGVLYTTLAAGETGQDTISWNSSELSYYHVEVSDITKIELWIHVSNSNFNISYLEHSIIWPQGEEAYEKPVLEISDNDMVIFDNEYMTLILLEGEILLDDDGDFIFPFFAENKTRQGLFVTMGQNGMLNGEGYDVNIGLNIPPESVAYCPEDIYQYQLEEAGIELHAVGDISSIKGELEIIETKNYETLMKDWFEMTFDKEDVSDPAGEEGRPAVETEESEEIETRETVMDDEPEDIHGFYETIFHLLHGDI